MKNNNKNRKMILVSIVFTLLFSVVLSGMKKNNLMTFAATGDTLADQIELQERYFVEASEKNVWNTDRKTKARNEDDYEKTDIYVYIMFAIPFIFAGISFVLWKIYGKDDQVPESLEFYPPEGFNSLEVGALYKGKAEIEDVISLLIYLANKGYIMISETEKKTLVFKNKSFKITKLKEYDGDNSYERIFMNGLFKGDYSYSKISSLLYDTPKYDTQKDSKLSEVTPDELHDEFHETVKEIIEKVNNDTKKLIEESGKGIRVCILLMIFVTLCTITAIPMIKTGDLENLSVTLMFVCFTFAVFFTKIFSGIGHFFKKGEVGIISIIAAMVLLYVGLFYLLPFSFIVLPILLEEKILLYAYIFGVLCILAMAICLKFLPKRNAYGNQMLGKIRGFKNFLETSEKQKLEALVMQDPQYFYNILPYTYVLGVSNVWISKFETIALRSPEWYDYSGIASEITSFIDTFSELIMTIDYLLKGSILFSHTSDEDDSSEGRSSGGDTSEKDSDGGGSSGGGSW